MNSFPFFKEVKTTESKATFSGRGNEHRELLSSPDYE